MSRVKIRVAGLTAVAVLSVLAVGGCNRSRLAYSAGPPVAVSGEPLLFESGESCSDAQGRWFQRADGNGDGVVDLAEAKLDAARFFASVDADANGFVTPVELTDFRVKTYPPEYRRAISNPMPPSEPPATTPGGTEIPDPEMRRFLLTPVTTDLVMSADADLDFRVSLAEIQTKLTERGAKLDANGDGALSRSEVAAFCN
ncbi:hypothetical protein L2U69_07860 [Zavarzinia compransoris]|uniref:EF-hand domain-containing protein n=1 Tax=Zavarzinia marina TaxID=2911065 RepID=UPI001F415B0A|nr:hypothetical protein [Zavarzinia marina]MCF4165553.1 hypothetical protein [Zavarzinia marina]